MIPFDYVATFPLSGVPGKQLDAEVPINVEGGFVTTSIGYGLAVDSLDVSVTNPNRQSSRSDAKQIFLPALYRMAFAFVRIFYGLR